MEAQSVITQEQIEHFRNHGWVRIPNVVDKEQCAKTVEEIKGFLKSACKISMHDARTWEKWPMSTHGFGECYSLPTMWENRQNPRVYEVFSALLEETKLWVSVDRVGSKRPGVLMVDGQPVEKREWHRDAFVHTDCNLWHPPKSLQIQGVLALEDTADDQGGFACIPDFNNEYKDWTRAARPQWVVSNPKKVFNKFPDTKMINERLTTIQSNAGDLVLWNSLLPHCNTRNVSDRWRFCQYIRMYPACEENEKLKFDALKCYRTGARPQFFSTGGRTPQDNLEVEKRSYLNAELTPLGRKLVGLDNWE